MAETVGWITDKLIIAELKISHHEQQLLRKDADESHRELCLGRLTVLRRQRDDLKEELTWLSGEILKGNVRPRVYRQFKTYNDKRFMPKANTSTAAEKKG